MKIRLWKNLRESGPKIGPATGVTNQKPKTNTYVQSVQLWTSTKIFKPYL